MEPKRSASRREPDPRLRKSEVTVAADALAHNGSANIRTWMASRRSIIFLPCHCPETPSRKTQLALARRWHLNVELVDNRNGIPASRS